VKTIARILVAVALVVGLLAPAGAALASTGGSMGGGSFHSSGGGGYHSSGSSYSSHRYSGSSSGSYSGGGDAGTAAAMLFVGLFGIWFIAAAVGWAAKLGEGVAAGAAMDVSVLGLALDARARKRLQERLRQIATAADTGTTAGLVTMLREVALELRRARDSWVYAGVLNAQPMRPAEAEALFRQQVQAARAGFTDELVRNADGVVTTAAAPADLVARTEEGPGLVLITVVVAARGVLLDFQDPSDAEQIRAWLESISSLHSSDLVAVEIIWTPAAEDDRMSSVELEAHFPGLKRLHGVSTVGKVYCGYCGGMFPAELLSCPHCGGKVERAG